MLGACSDSSTEANLATPLLNADIATMAADAAGEDVDIMREPVQFTILAPAFAPGNGDLNPASCPYNPATQRLVCALVIRNGSLSITRSYAFFDAANAVQQAYDALLTARANIITDVEGSHSGENWSATIDRHREFNVTGLAGTETQRTWNGNGTSSATRSRHTDDGVERSYDIDCTLTVTNVVVPVPNGSDRFPVSGTITRQCTVTFDGGPRDGQTVTRTAVLTFSGSETATMTVGDRTFDVNLRNRHRGPGRP
jgi:hypothetical protein